MLARPKIVRNTTFNWLGTRWIRPYHGLQLIPAAVANRSWQANQHHGAGASWLAYATTRHQAPITIGCLAVTIFFGIGLTQIDSTIRLQDRFLAIDDYQRVVL